MQGLFFPKSITKKLDSISANFLWGNKDKKKGLNWISWENICKPKMLGGLGFRTNEELNILGLTKQCWNLDNQNNWAARFMAEKYLRKNTGPISFKKGSFIWRNIGKGWNFYKDSLSWNPGSGKEINFWKDKWIGDYPLRELLIGPLDKGEEEKTLAEKAKNNRIELDTLPQNLPKIFKDLVQTITLSNDQDLLVSSWTNKGKFSNKASLTHIQGIRQKNTKPLQSDWNIIWSAPGHPKMNFFLWQTWWERNPTKENLFFRNCSPSPECPLCFHPRENMMHILRDCPRANNIWSKVNPPPLDL